MPGNLEVACGFTRTFAFVPRTQTRFEGDDSRETRARVSVANISTVLRAIKHTRCTLSPTTHHVVLRLPGVPALIVPTRAVRGKISLFEKDSVRRLTQ